jgi:hypothetical protein
MNPLTRPTPYLPDPPAPRADVVEDGVLEHAAANLAAGDLVPADTPLRTTKRARVRLASARIVIAASSELRWVAVDRTILLDRGSIDVESGAAGVARIVVKGFEVTVGDADVVVEPRSVHVRRGVVRVNGTELVAGTTWTPERKAPAKPGPAISEVLSRARAELAARNMDAAVRLASSVTSRSPSRAQLAEAQTILADVSLATGLLDDAAARYLGVAATFQDLPTAESAFYAAIRVRLRQHKPSARDLLEQYIARYPNGRYLLDARRQLATLGGSR